MIPVKDIEHEGEGISCLQEVECPLPVLGSGGFRAGRWWV